MTNPYYTPTGSPGTGAVGASATMRAEFTSVAAGFGLLPTLAGNAGYVVVVNGTANGLTAVTMASLLSGLTISATSGTLSLANGSTLATLGAYSVALTATGATTLTLPTSGTLATAASVASEVTRATAAEAMNATAISTEATRAQAAEALLAPRASPTFTGTPAVPTAAPGTNTTQAASAAFVTAAVGVEATRAAAAESTNASTITTEAARAAAAEALKAPLASPTFTGTLTASGTITGAAFSAYLASPPAIGGTAAGSGKFTTLSATGALTPSSTAGIVGTTSVDNANSGSVGEFISSTVLIGAAVALTSGVSADVTSISLTAGDWDVWGTVCTAPAGSTQTGYVQGWTAVASVSSPTAPGNGGEVYISTSAAAGAANYLPVGVQRVRGNATSTVYLSTNVSFSVSTMSAFGFLAARRVR